MKPKWYKGPEAEIGQQTQLAQWNAEVREEGRKIATRGLQHFQSLQQLLATIEFSLVPVNAKGSLDMRRNSLVTAGTHWTRKTNGVGKERGKKG